MSGEAIKAEKSKNSNLAAKPSPQTLPRSPRSPLYPHLSTIANHNGDAISPALGPATLLKQVGVKIEVEKLVAALKKHEAGSKPEAEDACKYYGNLDGASATPNYLVGVTIDLVHRRLRHLSHCRRKSRQRSKEGRGKTGSCFSLERVYPGGKEDRVGLSLEICEG